MNALRYYVVAEEVCGGCGGVGVVPNKAWETKEARHPSTDPRQFWREHGPEELPCGSCAGEGRTSRRVELGEALAALGLPGEAARA